MNLNPLFRAVPLPRRTRRPAPAGPVHVQVERRHVAMAGIDVSPVHGRHCICERCLREGSQAA